MGGTLAASSTNGRTGSSRSSTITVHFGIFLNHRNLPVALSMSSFVSSLGLRTCLPLVMCCESQPSHILAAWCALVGWFGRAPADSITSGRTGSSRLSTITVYLGILRFQHNVLAAWMTSSHVRAFGGLQRAPYHGHYTTYYSPSAYNFLTFFKIDWRRKPKKPRFRTVSRDTYAEILVGSGSCCGVAEFLRLRMIAISFY